MTRFEQRQRVKLLALAVGEALEAYVQLHDRIVKEAATARSVLKNIFGRGVSMADLLADAEALIPKLAATAEQVTDFRLNSARHMDPDVLRCLDLLQRYAEALQSTVDALVARQRLLAEGAKGGRGNPLTWPAYQAAEHEYLRAIEGYKAIGQQLNSAAPVVFR